MKTAKKAILLVLCAIALVVASIMGTLAYLQSTTDVVKNTFTAGKVVITSLDESDVDLYGVPVDGAARVKENEYKLIPGHKYTKDPLIVIEANSEDAFVYVEVINQIADAESKAVADKDLTIASQLESFGWTKLDGVENVYYKEYKSQDTELHYSVFECFKVDANANVDNFVGKTIQVKAYAVQKDGFGDSAKAAWDAANFDRI